jgi:hypothetical protein
MDKPRNRLPEMIFILLLLVVTAYLTTAYFVKFWPFKPAPSAGSQAIDLKDIAKDAGKTDANDTEPDLTKGVIGEGEGTYDLSDGKLYDCGDYLVAFPKDWMRIMRDGGKNVTGTDPNNPSNTVIIYQTEGLVADEASRAQTVEGISATLGSDYKIGDSEITDFLGRKCLLMSGTVLWNGMNAGLVILAVPDDKGSDFLVIGIYNPEKTENRDVVMGAMVTITPKTLK